ncbi:MAG: DUF2332 domain-containing protein [Actinomycetes bacterium]
MSTGELVRDLRFQAEACRELGSPLYADLLARVADDVAHGGAVGQVLTGYEDEPGSSAVGLRLMGTLHRLVLAGEAPALAAYYPSVGGRPDAAGAWQALLGVVEERTDVVREGLRRPPQTNEVGRASTLVGGLLHVAAAHRFPVRLVEIGASAGLNLRADSFRVETDTPGNGVGWGPTDSPVRLRAWRGALPPRDAPLRVVERRGCDLDPVDATTDEGRLTVTSYVWPDDTERLARLRGAIEVARAVPAAVERSAATDFLDQVEPVEDTTLVVWHSVMWGYLSRDERSAVTRRLDALGSAATDRAPVAHLAFEPRRRGGDNWRFVVTLRTWPGGEERELGEAAPHGVPVEWV